MSGYNNASMQRQTRSPGRPSSSAVGNHSGAEGSSSSTITVLRPYVPGAAPAVARRVLVPTHSRSIAGSIATPNYRYGPSKVNAVSRLDHVADEKDGSKKNNGLPFSTESANRMYRSNDKSRGLRHFSTKVCEKVKEKGRTNYNEVADELVAEYFDSLATPPQSVEKQQYDMKNIRRRVYDALNVLMAMNIIEKEKKEIRWVGLPTSSHQECRRYEDEKVQRQESIRKKTEQLQELVIQLVAYKTLVQRNRENERIDGRPADSKIIYLPFIVINTSRETVVDCSIASDKTEFLFHFDQPFEIHDDIEILKRLGLSYGLDKSDVAPEYRQHIKECLPNALKNYADDIIDGNLTANLPPSQPSPQLQQQQQQKAVMPVTSPIDRKVPIVRPINPGVRTIVPRGAKTVIRPRGVGATYHRAPPARSGQPYNIPPSSASVYRNVAQQHYALPPNRANTGQRYLQRTAPRLQTSYNTNIHDLNQVEQAGLHYEDDVLYGDEDYGYEG
uniref:Transcription factor Dp-1 n=1 Tax=Panagrolaimus sp. ES5 TaxID=591445 RepID=A0AC34GVT7_9BILA